MTMTRDLKLGLLLAVASLFGCTRVSEEQPAPGEEKRCVSDDGTFADDKACSGAATGSWGEDQRTRGVVGTSGYHYVYVPVGYYMLGASAAGFMRSVTPGSGHSAVAEGRVGAPARGGFGGTGSSTAEARGGFGATGTAHTTSAGS
jgi:hypothetical protein